MAEEVTEVVPAANPAVQPSALNLQSLQHVGSVFPPELLAEMEKATSDVVPATQTTVTTEKAAEQIAAVTPATEIKTEEEKKVVPEYNSAFGFNKPKQPAKEIKIENPDQLLEVIKSNYGQELKSINELPKFLGSVNKWREDSQKIPSLEKTLDQYKTLFESQPKAIIEAMKLNAAG